MKYLLLLILFVPFHLLSQSDSIYIQFIHDNDTFPDCHTIYAVNGKYAVKKSEQSDLKLPGMVFVDPTDVFFSEYMSLFSLQGKIPKDQFEYPVYYWKEYNYKEIEEIYKRDSSKTYWSVENYIDSKDIIFFRNQSSNSEYFPDTIKVQEPIIKEININGGPVYVPAEGIVDGVFIEFRHYLDLMPFFEANPIVKDSINLVHTEIRSKFVQPKLDSILQPFYLSNHEITNREYREFINYVRDSIAIHILYNKADDDLALTLINLPKRKQKKLDKKDKKGNYTKYGLKKVEDFKGFYENPNHVPFLAEMYFPQPQRYYKRREMDTKNLIYKVNDSTFVPVYPDSTKLSELGFYHSMLSNMYFWHPANDNYPVQCLSNEQIQAFCHWKEYQINKSLQLDSFYIEVSIPTITQYELALHQSFPDLALNSFDRPNKEFVSYERPEIQQIIYLKKSIVSAAMIESEPSSYLMWYNSNYNPVFLFMNGNVSEIVSDLVTNELLEFYGLPTVENPEDYCFVLGDNYQFGVKTKDDYQQNAIFYKRIIKKAEASPTTGFRLVYKWKRK